MVTQAKSVKEFVEDNSPLSPIDLFVTNISSANSQQVTTVYRCINLISDALATVPINIMQGRDNEAIPVPEHELFFLLNYKPNTYMSAPVFKKLIVAQLLTSGNAYIYKQPAQGRILLTPLATSAVKPELQDDLTITYTITTKTGEQVEVTADEIIHIKYNSLDGVTGQDPIRLHKQVLETENIAQTFTATSMRERNMPLGIIKTKTALSPDRKDKMRGQWGTMARQGGVVVFEQGMEFQPLSLTQDQAQFLQSREYNAVEIATKIFGLHPYWIGATSAEKINLETISNSLIDSVLPFAQIIATEIRNGFLEETEWLNYELVFDLTKLRRFNREAVDNSLKTRVVHGIISPNEARSEIDRQRLEGLDYTLTPANAISSKYIDEWSQKQVAQGDSTKVSQATQTGGDENEPEENRSLETLEFLFTGLANVERGKLERLKEKGGEAYGIAVATHFKACLKAFSAFASDAQVREFFTHFYPVQDLSEDKPRKQARAFLRFIKK